MSKKITIKTEKILEVFNILNGAKYAKLEDGDKVKLWKVTRKLKPIAVQFEDDTKDACEKFKEGFENLDERLQNAQEFEAAQRNPDADVSGLKMGAAEHDEFIKGDWNEYNKLVGKAVKEFAEKEVEVEFEEISEDAFAKLMASNNWTFGQVCALEEIIL